VATRVFFQNFSRGGQKWRKLNFPLKTKKIIFLCWKFQNLGGASALPSPPSDAHAMYYCTLWSFIIPVALDLSKTSFWPFRSFHLNWSKWQTLCSEIICRFKHLENISFRLEWCFKRPYVFVALCTFIIFYTSKVSVCADSLLLLTFYSPFVIYSKQI